LNCKKKNKNATVCFQTTTALFFGNELDGLTVA
jgi:tRNA C32,U32 (ribose-2'-O)-methylase TrmJ